MSHPERDQLRQMLLDRSMRFGEFVLSSGATSNYYIDVRKTSLHPGTELEFVIMVIAVSCVKLLSAHNSTQHTSRKHKV